MASKRRWRALSAGVAILLAGGAVVTDATVGSAATLPVLRLPTAVIGQVEGNTGSTSVTLTATMDRISATPVTVNYTTANGTATTADLDYTAAAGTLTFAPGTTTQTITVAVNGDTKLEDFQRFSVRLSTPSGATIAAAAEFVEIRNDEKPKFAMAAPPVAEGATAQFVPKLIQRYAFALTASAQTSDRTAIAPADYTRTVAPLTFAAGAKTATNLAVRTFLDGGAEANETFAVTLTSPSAAASLTKLTTIGASPTVASPTCNTGQSAPTGYDKVVVFSFENRTWAQAGGVGFGPTAMPYAHALAAACPHFANWTEANPAQNSATQYVSQAQGNTAHTVLSDCVPSATCNSQTDNIFRQARVAGKTAVNYVEGATVPCSAAGNAAKHIPALYFWGETDRWYCNNEVRPYTDFDPTDLADFSFITPTECNDGHDCANTTVDAWMRQNLGPVIASPDYQAGRVLIEIWYDEDTPVPNVYVAPSGLPGPLPTPGIGYASTLALWEGVLGLPCLANGCTAPDIRAVTGI